MEISPSNKDLNEIFHNNPEYVNNEYILKAKVKDTPLYLDPQIEGNDELLHFIQQQLVTIVTPHSYDNIKDKTKKDAIEILQCTYENGRALQSSNNIMIDGVQHEVVLKGIGSTTYARDTGAINPWMRRDGYKMEEKEKQELEKFAFYDNSGCYTKEQALQELGRSKMLSKLGVDTEKVLGIYELSEVLGENGNYISIKELENQGTITNGMQPVILIRAHKTNIRLLDPIMMDEYKCGDSIQNVMDTILSDAKLHWGVENINDYLQNLFEKIITNRLELAGSFGTINGEKWQDICRNITLFGEEIDLGQMIPMKDDWNYTNPNYILDQHSYALNGVFTGLKGLIATIEEHSNYQIDHEQLSETIYDTILKWIRNNVDDQKEFYNKYGWDKWYEDKGFNQYISILFKKCFSSFLNYIPQQKYQEILRKKLETKIKP